MCAQQMCVCPPWPIQQGGMADFEFCSLTFLWYIYTSEHMHVEVRGHWPGVLFLRIHLPFWLRPSLTGP